MMSHACSTPVAPVGLCQAPEIGPELSLFSPR